MKKSLFVAGLDFSINDAALKEIFAEHGTVETAKVVTDKYSGQSRGFGFVDMSNQQEAQQCVEALNNTSVKGRQLVVKFKEDKPANGNSRGGFAKRW